jgi:hypothetical protein
VQSSFILSNSSIVCFLKVIKYLLTSSPSSFRPFFNNLFYKTFPMQNVKNSIRLHSLYCTCFLHDSLE